MIVFKLATRGTEGGKPFVWGIEIYEGQWSVIELDTIDSREWITNIEVRSLQEAYEFIGAWMDEYAEPERGLK